MSYTTTTLQDTITAHFGGRGAALAKAAGIDRSTVSRLTRGSIPLNPATLTTICQVIPAQAAADLCLALCRDTIPPEYSSRVSIAGTSRSSTGAANPRLDPHSESILHQIRVLTATDPGTRAWLHQIGRWLRSSTDPDIPPRPQERPVTKQPPPAHFSLSTLNPFPINQIQAHWPTGQARCPIVLYKGDQ